MSGIYLWPEIDKPQKYAMLTLKYNLKNNLTGFILICTPM